MQGCDHDEQAVAYTSIRQPIEEPGSEQGQHDGPYAAQKRIFVQQEDPEDEGWDIGQAVGY